MHKRRWGRPTCPRIVSSLPEVSFFKPQGVPMKDLEVNRLSVEELEAMVLVDMRDMEQEDAAKKMGVSRRTLARELSSGRKKLLDALVSGKAIEIKGGNYISSSARLFVCGGCGKVWDAASGSGRPQSCPSCSGTDIRRKSSDQNTE
jgi:hypothetical protein